jgi:hypothetical protein
MTLRLLIILVLIPISAAAKSRAVRANADTCTTIESSYSRVAKYELAIGGVGEVRIEAKCGYCEPISKPCRAQLVVMCDPKNGQDTKVAKKEILESDLPSCDIKNARSEDLGKFRLDEDGGVSLLWAYPDPNNNYKCSVKNSEWVKIPLEGACQK